MVFCDPNPALLSWFRRRSAITDIKARPGNVRFTLHAPQPSGASHLLISGLRGASLIWVKELKFSFGYPDMVSLRLADSDLATQTCRFRLADGADHERVRKYHVRHFSPRRCCIATDFDCSKAIDDANLAKPDWYGRRTLDRRPRLR
jgi:hypothetical protein